MMTSFLRSRESQQGSVADVVALQRWPMVGHRGFVLSRLGIVPADDILGVTITRHGWQMDR
jgi:hypothetical protein